MRGKGAFSLKKPKLRQSWNKYNLYNLSRATNPQTQLKTFFQQKWKAKAIARAYHGEKVTEGHWERAFSRRLRAVVPMDARYLAQNDGSNESAGRGSGLDIPGAKRNVPNTPYMQMTFAPLERRLDTCIFRALFASSARQARQFVVHGHVTVNGKKMRYPGYLLNPGDMFQVDPELVMFATGAPKDPKERRTGRIRKRMGRTPPAEAEEASADKEAKDDEEGGKKQEAGEEQEHKEEEDPRKTLKNLMSQAQGLLSVGRGTLPAKRKQDLRAFRASVRRLLSRSGSSTALTENMELQFSRIKDSLEKSLQQRAAKEEEEQRAQEQQRQAASAQQSSEQPAEQSAEQSAEQPSQQAKEEPTSAQFSAEIEKQNHQAQQQSRSSPESAETGQSDEQSAPSEELVKAFSKASLNPDAELPTNLSEADTAILERALFQMHNNPIDSTKPYATPWRPRDFMSAFAFIPRYLEVNQNICAAVYLRHPVARPGVAEVPTPFSEQINGTAFAWYLRRR